MSCSISQCTYGDDRCVRAKLAAALSHHFGYSVFRDGQLDVMLPMMHCHDVMVQESPCACFYLLWHGVIRVVMNELRMG